MLYQGRDDEKWVVLTKNLNTIHAYFGKDGNHPGGGEVDPDFELGSILSSNYGSRGDSRRDSRVSISSLPANIPLATTTTTALLLGSAALAVASIETCPEVKFDPSPGNSKKGSASTLLEVSPSPPSSSSNLAPEVTKSKFTTKGLRSSFRKLVKPLVKKRDTGKSDEPQDDDDHHSLRESLSFSLSRRGSKMSHKSDSIDSSMNNVAGNEAKNGVQARWKKVLGVSLAIGRYCKTTFFIFSTFCLIFTLLLFHVNSILHHFLLHPILSSSSSSLLAFPEAACCTSKIRIL